MRILQELANLYHRNKPNHEKALTFSIAAGMALSSCQSDVVDPTNIDITSGSHYCITSWRDWSNHGSFAHS